MSWFKVDDKFHDHPKARRAGLAACGLWLRAGTWSADMLTDGFVPDDVLPRWGTRGVDVFELADTLVEVGLWERVDDDADPGYRFRKWDKYQPTRAEVVDRRSAKSDGGTLGNHRRWHEGRNAFDAACPHCVALESVDRSDNRLGTESSRPGPVPVPSRSSVDARPTPRPVDNPGMSDDDLDRIGEKIGGDRDYARRVAAEVLDRAGDDVRKPLAYVLRAIAAEPARYRRARGNPRPGQTGECGRHPGQWADTCRSCAADRIAGA